MHTIEVTLEDIREGKKQNSVTCPIARAAKRQVAPDGYQAGVGLVTLSVYPILHTGNFYFTGLLPREAQDFISLFDKELPVKPFKFEIDLLSSNDS